MGNNVISLSEKREQKELDNQKRLAMPIYDFYIPYGEIPFWEQVSTYMKETDWKAGLERNVGEIEEFVTAFVLDIGMYRDFGDTLEKFRFLFSHLELYVLHSIMLQMKDVEHEELLNHYRSFLADMLKENVELSRLIN